MTVNAILDHPTCTPNIYIHTHTYINIPRLQVRSDLIPAGEYPTEQCVLGTRKPQTAVRANSTLQGEPRRPKCGWPLRDSFAVRDVMPETFRLSPGHWCELCPAGTIHPSAPWRARHSISVNCLSSLPYHVSSGKGTEYPCCSYVPFCSYCHEKPRWSLAEPGWAEREKLPLCQSIHPPPAQPAIPRGCCLSQEGEL